MRILIVCSGNTCRSPMAEVILKEELDRAGIIGIEVRSAGIMSPGGEPMNNYSATTLAAGGYDTCPAFRSTALNSLSLETFDKIFCMTQDQVAFVNRRYPVISGRTRTLALTASGTPADIFDPFGAQLETYLKTFEEIRNAVVKLVVELKEEKRKEPTL